METKEFKINIPKGYEIDKDNSTFECIKFKLIKKDITYEDVAEELFSKNIFAIDLNGIIVHGTWVGNSKFDINNAANRTQLEKLLALNQLLNIAEYYNRKSSKEGEEIYYIRFNKAKLKYCISYCNATLMVVHGLLPMFNNIDDAQAVIDNLNFREILDTIYK
jgi:hypothetical protein|nr:MAG TPA: hypothetical protein [Crassvirales sp.]